IIRKNLRAQCTHPLRSLGRAHINRAFQAIRNLVDVVWIYQQRLCQLFGSACKFAQNQHAIVIDPRGHEFLCHQVHSVTQRSKQRDIGGTVVGYKFLRAELGVEIAQRHPSLGREAADDATDLLVELALEHRIVSDLRTRGYRDQHQRHPFVPNRIALEKAFIAEQPFEYPLSVVEPIDPQDNDLSARRMADSPYACDYIRTCGELGEKICGDPQRKRTNLYRAHPDSNLAALAIDLEARDPFAAI